MASNNKKVYKPYPDDDKKLWRKIYNEVMKYWDKVEWKEVTSLDEFDSYLNY